MSWGHKERGRTTGCRNDLYQIYPTFLLYNFWRSWWDTHFTYWLVIAIQLKWQSQVRRVMNHLFMYKVYCGYFSATYCITSVTKKNILWWSYQIYSWCFQMTLTIWEILSFYIQEAKRYICIFCMIVKATAWTDLPWFHDSRQIS